MVKARFNDRAAIIEILVNAFNDNKSVNYIVRQDRKRGQRLKSLMEYSFDVCYMFGEIFLSENKKSCALILLPDNKKISLKSIWLDLKLIFNCTGLANVSKAMDREAKIKKRQPKELLYYLWFIGVDPADQSKGIGSALLKEVINEGTSKQRTICLETSTLANIAWYEKFGFKIYNELDLGYKLFFLKKE